MMMEINGNGTKQNDEDMYLNKLDKSLLLILNDQPDHRDDTIISKLLDSLQAQLESGQKSDKLVKRLREFISEHVLESDLDAKEHEVTKFALDLISISLKANQLDTNYLQRVFSTLDTLTSIHQENISNMNPPVLVSLIQLLCQLDQLPSLDRTLLGQYQSQINRRLLDSAQDFIDFESSSPKSIYLRREFKRFYLNRLKRDREIRINQINPSNWDIVSEIIKAELTSLNDSTPILETSDDIIGRLKSLGDEFGAKQMDFVINYETSLKNETQIEGFACMSGLSVLLWFMSPCEMDQMPDKKEALLNEKFIKTVNKICNHFSTTPPNDTHLSARDSQRQLGIRLNIMFKFIIGLYSFLNDQFLATNSSNRFTNLLGFDFRPTREALKFKLALYLATPLYLKLNNSNSSPPLVDENYLLILNELSFESRLTALSQSLLNLRLFVRKFPSFAIRLLEFVGSNQIMYLLRNTNLDPKTKSDILDLCSDVFETTSSLNSSQIDHMLSILKHVESSLVIEEKELMLAMVRYISMVMSHLPFGMVDLDGLVIRLAGLINSGQSLAELNCLDLEIIGDRKEAARVERSILPRLSQLVDIMSDMMNKNPNENKFELVNRVLGYEDYRVLKLALSFLFVEEDGVVVDESLNDLRQAVYLLLNCLFRFTMAKPDGFEIPPLSGTTIQMVEKKCASESEAFVRREMVSFLSSYHLNRLRHSDSQSASISLFNSLNFFSHLLSTDLDWEVQLNCLGHLGHVIRLVTSDIDKYSSQSGSQSHPDLDCCPNVSSKFSRHIETANPIEIVFVHSECLPTLMSLVDLDSCYDRVVVGAAAELLIGIKQNEVLVSVLTRRAGSSCPLDSVGIESLEEILSESKLSSDIYIRRPMSILDDIISSYQFDMDDDKAADCY